MVQSIDDQALRVKNLAKKLHLQRNFTLTTRTSVQLTCHNTDSSAMFKAQAAWQHWVGLGHHDGRSLAAHWVFYSAADTCTLRMTPPEHDKIAICCQCKTFDPVNVHI